MTILATQYWKLFLKEYGSGLTISYGVKIDVPSRLSLGQNVYIGKGTVIGSERTDGFLVLGDNVQINNDCLLDYTGGLSISAGTLISAETIIYTHSHGYDPRSEPIPIKKTILNDCWIGVRSIIGAKAIMIEKNVIVAAGSNVVSSCLEPNAIYGGTPAKMIKTWR